MTLLRPLVAVSRPALWCAAFAVVVLAGCQSTGEVPNTAGGATASDPSLMTRSGFLTDYARLRSVEGYDVKCWRADNLEAKRYDKILISRIVVTLKTDPQKGIDPTDLKTLVDYFHAALVKAFEPQMQVVTTPGPGVLVLRTALTDLMPTDSTRSLLGTAVPYGFVAEAGSGAAAGRPAGSTPYLGQTGVEMQFADGATGANLGECADTQVGRKYAAELDQGVGKAAQTWASGYVGSFQAWTYAKDAFDKWSVQIAQRVAVLRGVGGAPR
ncbi:MAG: DUF3313 domain-containing protein [Burkholderiales bacterium]